MGKRELLLIVVFIALGTAVYQFTAAPAVPGQEGFSFSRVLQTIRREMRGQNFKVEVERTARAAADADLKLVSLREFRGQVTVTGEDRPSVEAHLSTEAYGLDEAEARAEREKVQLSLTQHGDTLEVSVTRPPGGRRARHVLRLAIPARVAVRLEGSGRVEATGVDQVTLDTRLGDVLLRNVKGGVRGDHRDGDFSVDGASGVTVDVRRSSVRLERIGAGGILGEYADGRLIAREVAGKVVLETHRMDVELESLSAQTLLTVDDGRVTVRHASGPVEFKGRRARFSLEDSAAAMVNATSEGAPVELSLPSAGGVTLDLTAEDGRIELKDGVSLDVTRAEGRQRVAGPVAGGGPGWSVRTTRGDIIIRR